MLILLSFVLSVFGTERYRHYALAKQILDVPNARSAHHLPTPRGGGVVFVLIFLVAMLYLHMLPQTLLLIGLGVGILGYLDDQYDLSAWIRLVCQAGLCALALYSLPETPEIFIGSWHLPLQGWTIGLALLYLMWMLNLYNFMDGINGIAGFEAMSVVLGMGCLYFAVGIANGMEACLIVAAAVAGFLIWNFPKAKIFMGDVGSSFLGFLFGIWSLYIASRHPALWWSWLILLGVFIVDATLTLFLRMLKREALHQAHANHAYQIAARHFNSHSVVTLSILCINVLWLWPCAFAVGLGYIQGITGMLIAYLPLVALVGFFKCQYHSSRVNASYD